MLQDLYRGALANDKTGTPARTGGQIINDNFAYLDNKITRKDSIVVSTGYAGTPEDKIMNIYWEWIIDTIDYTNPAPVPLNFPYAASGKMRLDMIALTTSNTAIRIAGPESDSNPVSAPLPDNMIQAGLVLVTDSEVGEPSSPVIGDLYVKKIESQDFIFNSGATTVINQIDLIDDRSSISLIGSATDVKSVQLSTAFIRPGKPHFFKNRSGHDVKLWQLAGTGNIKYFFPNGLDLIVKPNEVIEFNTNANDSAYVRFEYVGKEINLDDYYTKAEVDAKLPSNYSQIVYVNSNDPNTATIFSLDNPPLVDDPLLHDDDANLYIGDDASTWVYKTSTGLYESEIVVSNLGSQIVSSPEKTTIVDNDKVGIADSQDLNKTKHWKWSTIKLWLLDYFRGQIEISASTAMQPSWKGKLIIFTANCTITVPASLASEYAFEGYTMTGVTVTWAITSPKTWENGTPVATTEKMTVAFFQRGSTNSVILLQ